MTRVTDVRSGLRDALESISSWKNRAEHAEKRLREIEREPETKTRDSRLEAEGA